MVELIPASQEVFAVKQNRKFSHCSTASNHSSSLSSSCRSQQAAASTSAGSLSFIQGDELDKRLSLDFEQTSLDAADSEACSSSASSSPGVSSPTSHSSLLLIDLRSLFQYHESHVRQSINLTNCALMSKRIQDGKLQIKEYLEARVMFDGTQDVVIYEQGDSKEGEDSLGEGWSGVTDFARLIFLNLTKVKSTSAKIEILRGGFDSFRKRYPRHCTQGVPLISRFTFVNCNDDEMAFLNWEATQIRENMFLGALHDAQNDELLDRLGITHILNCCKTDSRANDVTGRYEYLELMCDDNLQQSLDDKLGPAFKFIDSVMQRSGSKVLIHCYAGISRSAAITIAYMMYRMGMTYDESYKELKQKRSIVAPNINFISQLMKYDDERKQQKMRHHSTSVIPEGAKILLAGDSVPEKRADEATQLPNGDEAMDTSDGSSSFGLFQKPDNFGKEIAQRKLLPPPKLLQANTPAVNGGSRLAAKRKMLRPMQIKLQSSDGNKQGGLIAASAPIISNEYNPFANAFKKANSECGEHSFARKMDSLFE